MTESFGPIQRSNNLREHSTSIDMASHPASFRSILPPVTARLSQDLADRVLASHPLPIADATAALVAADSPFEQRDRVVEVFRAITRYLAALVLAARVQFGPGPAGDSLEVKGLYRALRSRGLTDGQWFGLVREVLRPFDKTPDAHPLPDLVKLVHARKPEFVKLIDELLLMRKAETVAHGATGTKAALSEILAKRVPQLARLLELLDPLWQKARLVAPLAPGEDGEPQRALLLMGDTPPRGRFRRIELGPSVRLSAGECILADPDGKPLLALHPLILVRPPSPEASPEFFTLDGGTKKGAVYVAIPSMAEHRDAEVWKVLEKQLAGEESEGPEGETKGPSRPYRGLSSFGPEDAGLFFGRETQSESLANRIRRAGFVTVTGPSGSGKSSLLGAGVLPLLSDWKRIIVRPGAHPLEALAAKLAPPLDDFCKHDDLLARLRSNPKELGALLSEFGREKGARLVIVVDQAEEMLTLCEDEKERLAYAQALASAGSDPDGPCRVVLSLREDFFGRLATIAPLRGLYSRDVEVVTTPDRDALARAVYAPAKAFGYVFEDDELVWTMVDAVSAEPAALALLSFCCDKLWDVRDRTWKRLGWDAYRGIGGVEGALAAHADKVLEGLGPAERRVCRTLFLRLVTGERTRAVVSRAELVEGAGGDGIAGAVLERLVQARLVTVSDAERPGEARVEIVHEALIRHWRVLSGWLEEDVEGQRLAQALRQAAREWDGRNRPKGLLWRGDVLEEYRLWRRRAAEPLAGVERAFAEASVADEQRGKRLRRALVASALVVTSAFGVFMFFQWRSAVAAREAMARARARAEVRGLLAEARSEEPAGRPDKALALLRAAAEAAGSAESSQNGAADRDFMVDHERLERSGQTARVLPGHTDAIFCLATSPDGKRFVTGSVDKTAKIWDIETGACIATLPDHGHVVESVAFSPDGALIATASGDPRAARGALRIFDARTGEGLHAIETNDDVLVEVHFSHDGTFVLTRARNGTVSLWDSATGARLQMFHPEAPIIRVALSPDDTLLAVTSGKTAVLFSTTTGEAVEALFGATRPLRSVAFSADSQFVAAGGSDADVFVFSQATGEVVTMLGGHDAAVRDVVFSPDGALVATAMADPFVRIFNLASHDQPTLLQHPTTVDSIAFSPDGKRLATSAGAVLRLWDAATGVLISEFRGHEDEVQAFAFTPNGKRIVTGSADRSVRIWDPTNAPLIGTRAEKDHYIMTAAVSADGKRVVTGPIAGAARIWDLGRDTTAPLGEGRSRITAVAMTSDGALAATGDAKGVVEVWESSDGKKLKTMNGHTEVIASLAFSPDGRRLGSASEDGKATLWDPQSGAVVATLAGHEARVTAIAFSPRGRFVATTSWDKTARLWDASTGAPIATLPAHEGRVYAVTFSSDEKLVATASTHTARLWDTATGQEKAMLTGHEQRVTDLVFSPNDKMLVTGSADGRLRLFDVASMQLLRVFSGHEDRITTVAFSPTGAELVSASADATARVWEVSSGKILGVFASHQKTVAAAMFLPSSRDVLTIGYDGRLLTWRASSPYAGVGPGAFTNLRVCPGSLAVVPVVPFPAADTVWASERVCPR